MMKKLLLLLLVCCLSVSVLAERYVYKYGWEDNPSTPTLGAFRSTDVIASTASAGDSDPVQTGSYSLELVDNDTGYPSDELYGEQAYICQVNGLEDGDVVIGKYSRYNDSSVSTADVGVRISANYVTAAGGYLGYFDDTSKNDAGIGTTDVWEDISYVWTYDASVGDSEGSIMILARQYMDAGDTVYLDDLEVTIPDHASIILPNGSVPTTPDEILADPDPNLYVYYTYDWEDGFADTLLVYSNAYEPTNVNYNGDRVLKVTEFPTTYTDDQPEVTLAWITGLNTADNVEASFECYDDTNGAAPSIRIYAAYANSTDLTSYYGSAGGNEIYSGDEYTGWGRIGHSWQFAGPSGSDALRIVARMYTAATGVDSQDFYIDDVNVVAPDHATVIFPGDLYKATDYTKTEYSWENFDGQDSQSNVFLGTFAMINAETVSEVYDANDNVAVSVSNATESYTMTTLKQAMGRGYEVGFGSTLTPSGYMAVVSGLNQNDYVKASVFAKSYDGQLKAGESGSTNGLRIWAHYIYDKDDIYSYAGSAGGSNAYTNDQEWIKLSHHWTFSTETYTDDFGNERTPEAIVFVVRAYSENGAGGIIDDLAIQAPTTATVSFPDPAKAGIVVGGFPAYDLDLSGKTDLTDFAIFASDWLSCNLQPETACN